MNGNINNQSGGCRPASAQIQQEQLEIERQMLWMLRAISAPQSPLRAKIEFSYSDVHERQIYPARANELITRVVLIVLEAFNDTESRVSVGDAADTQRLLSEDKTSLTLPCAFEARPNYHYEVGTSISLYLAPGAATTGRGVFYLYSD